jgi:hypothetical protein
MAALAVAVLLSGCGIRDTALPVDAGEGASRTACPPTSGASLSQLEGEAFPSPSSGGGLTTIPWASLAPASTGSAVSRIPHRLPADLRRQRGPGDGGQTAAGGRRGEGLALQLGQAGAGRAGHAHHRPSEPPAHRLRRHPVLSVGQPVGEHLTGGRLGGGDAVTDPGNPARGAREPQR